MGTGTGTGTGTGMRTRTEGPALVSERSFAPYLAIVLDGLVRVLLSAKLDKRLAGQAARRRDVKVHLLELDRCKELLQVLLCAVPCDAADAHHRRRHARPVSRMPLPVCSSASRNRRAPAWRAGVGKGGLGVGVWGVGRGWVPLGVGAKGRTPPMHRSVRQTPCPARTSGLRGACRPRERRRATVRHTGGPRARAHAGAGWPATAPLLSSSLTISAIVLTAARPLCEGSTALTDSPT